MAAKVESSRAKSWPPMVALVVGFLMVFVALPNPLRIPSNNPNATAELAPVPGKSQNQQDGALTDLGFTGSPGIGSGPTQIIIPPLPPGEEVPLQKECVGDPPRQTEDPLSPPCVPYFGGENGGATWRGVTGTEIRVVFYNDLCIKGDMNAKYKPSDECGNEYETINVVKTTKYQLKYFLRRFQTYGRTVHLIAYPSGSGAGTTPRNRRKDAIITRTRFDPFAAVYLGNTGGEYLAKIASFGVPGFGLNEDVQTQFYEEHRPYIWSFYPDQETEAALSASAICRKLLGRGEGDVTTRLPARFANDQTLRTQPRKIGFIYGVKSGRGPEPEQLAKLLARMVKQKCNYEFDESVSFSGGAGAGASEAPGIMANFKLKGITTIVCYCIPVPNEVTVTTMLSAASGANYYPEWYWDHQSRMDKPIWQEIYGSRDQFSFGTSYYWRMPAFRDQPHYKAYTSETGDGSQPNARWNFNIYYLLMNLFTGIQASGPNLTPEAVERGMFTFKYANPAYPWLPTGSYGLDGPSAYTFIDTFMGWWWDPTGTAPGSNRPGAGCLRLIQDGRRWFDEQWPLGDADFDVRTNSANPCTDGPQKISEPQASDF